MNEEKFISLDNNLKPENAAKMGASKKTQSDLLEIWMQQKKLRDERSENTKALRENKPVKDEEETESIKKTFVLGSKEEVNHGPDVGLFAALLCSYNNHWVLKTCPEDWWITISQKIAMAIDKNANHPDVRQFFVSHEGKKTLTVEVGPSIYGVDYEWFFKQMRSQISKNINNPEYTDLTDCNFSQSTSVQKIVNDIMLMYGFKEYFEYRMMMLCGIPGVTMVGTEDDWKSLIEKHGKLEKFLEPLDNVLELSVWFQSSRSVLEKLLETYQGKPDTDWWSKIISRRRYGSGGQNDFGGWFLKDFLGLGSNVDLKDIPSGFNVVPLTITDGFNTEEADLAAGVTGYKVEEDAVMDEETKTTYPMVQSVHGWGLFLKPNSAFR